MPTHESPEPCEQEELTKGKLQLQEHTPEEAVWGGSARVNRKEAMTGGVVRT